MRLDSLELAGFMHFGHARLDLRTIPCGVVAIVGENGHGKTTWLDAAIASLYGPGQATGAFPSREGTLATYATARDAHLEACWSLEGGGSYRAKIAVDGVARNTEAVLLEVLPDGREIALNDGLIRSYREAVSQRFPSRRQVLASAYAAQGRQGSFSGMDQKGRSELFAELIDIRHYEPMAETARRCVVVAEKARAGVSATLAMLKQETAPDVEQSLLARHQELQDTIAQHVAAKATREAVVREAESRRSANLVDATRCAEARAVAKALAATDAANRQQIASGDRKTAETTTLLEGQIATVRAQIESKTHLLEQADAIRQAVEARRAQEQALDNLRLSTAAIRDDLKTRQAVADTCVATIRDLRQKAGTLADARRKVETLQDVPCLGEGPFAACRFLTDAAGAQELIPGLVAAVSNLPRYEIEDIEVRAALDATHVRLAFATAQEETVRASLKSETLSVRAGELAVAEEQVRQYKAREAGLHTELARTRNAWTEQRASYEQAIIETQAELAVAQEIVVQTSGAQARVDAADAELQTARAGLISAEASIARAESQTEELDRRIQEFESKRAQVGIVGGRLKEIEDELLAWSLLAKALGRDGLPRLEIDAAGPTVSSLTNDLLAVGYGTRFSIDLTTQVAKADGKGMKEEFAVRVFDNTAGGERDILDLSGGERVVVEEALRAGILLYNNARNRRPIRTCWRDETTGALDPANVPRYVAMLRRMHQLGGFAHTLFVTHSEAAAELADTVIRVTAGVPVVERAA